jgi:hypothetical protein
LSGWRIECAGLVVDEQPKDIQGRFWDELTREASAMRGEEVRITK